MKIDDRALVNQSNEANRVVDYAGAEDTKVKRQNLARSIIRTVCELYGLLFHIKGV